MAREPSFSRALAFVGLAFLASGLVSALVVWHYAPHGQPSAFTGASGFVSAQPDGDPFIDGVKLSDAVAQSRLPFHLYMPNDPMASASTEQATWFESVPTDDGGTHFEVCITYQSGIIMYEKAATTIDPQSAYEKTAAGMQAVGAAVTTVAGVPAMVIPQSSDVTGGNPASVDLTIKGVQISLIGQASLSTLERAAETLS
jgi:hypothetical protein